MVQMQRGSLLSPTTTVALALVAGALLLTWIFAPSADDLAPLQTPPGQYQIHQRRWEWPGTEKSVSYGPKAGGATNHVRFHDAPPPKVTCLEGQGCLDL